MVPAAKLEAIVDLEMPAPGCSGDAAFWCKFCKCVKRRVGLAALLVLAPEAEQGGGASQNIELPSEGGRVAWYALYTRARHEKTVHDNLAAKGYEVLSPSYKVRRRRADRTVDLELPFFPGYVFCRFDALKRLAILKIPSIVFIVSQAGEPVALDPKEVESVRRIAQSKIAVQPWAFVRNGVKIRVRAGALAGTEGVLVRVKNQNRLVVLVTALERAVSVEIDQDIVEPLY